MRALLTEIHEVVAARRRRRFVATALASLAVVAGGTALAVTAGSDAHSPPCSDASEQLAEIWDGARRSALESALLRVPGGDAAFPRVASVIDRYAAEWAAIRTDACEATAVRGTQPPRVRDLRMACLDRARIQLRELVDQLMEPHFDITRLAVAAAEALPALDACSDADALRAIVSPPIGPMARSQLPTQVHAGTTESASREPASGDEPAATHRPEFRLPFGCGETWQLTYPPGHDPAGRQIDFTLPGDAPATGLAVFASAPGWVSAVVPGNGEVDLNHGDGWFTTYQHMTNVSVTLHQYVGRGHVLGKVGNTGVKNALGGPGTAHLRYAQLHQPGVISADFDHDPGRAMVDPSFDNEVFDRGARRAQSRTSTNNCPGGGTPAGAAQYDMPVSSSVFSRTESTMEIATHRSDDHALYERWYHDGWDGAPLPHTIAGRPAVVVYRGDLHIFVRKSDGTILDLRYDPFSGWATTYLDGKMAGDPDAVVYGWDQRLVVAARGEDGWLYQWWTVNGSWSHKVRVGNIAAVGTPALFSHYDTLYIVARTPDGAMRSWETDRRRTWTERHLAGVASDDPDIGVDPRSGRVNVVARATPARLYRWQAGEAHGAGGWSTPELIDADLVIAGAPATTIYHGAMRIIARDRNGAVHHWWKDTTWHREDTLGAYSSDPTVVQYGEQLQTVGRGIDGILHTTWYEPTGRMWQVETQDVPVAD
jgi:murein DD-endopeptidase MepM/ murein hydrolase activator NlpD